MRTVFAYDKLHEVASRGFDHGARMRSLTTMEWNLAGQCSSPVHRVLTAREPCSPLAVHQTRFKRSATRRDIEFTVRCGKCPPCLKRRATYWRFRASNEIKAVPRTWFVTLTLSPAEHFNMLLRASHRMEERCSGDFERLSDDGQFAERHREVSLELTKWLKRVRKSSGAPLRYCLVAEAHKSGLPHYHALVHELDPARPVRASVLRKQWKLGFSKVKLVAQGDETKSATYVSKYLAKSAISRVRASVGYGHSLPSMTRLSHSHSKSDVNATTNDANTTDIRGKNDQPPWVDLLFGPPAESRFATRRALLAAYRAMGPRIFIDAFDPGGHARFRAEWKSRQGDSPSEQDGPVRGVTEQ